MPQAFLEVGLYLVEAWGVSAATASLIVSVAYYAAAAALLNAAVKALTPSIPKGIGRGMEVNVTDATSPGRILYGTLKIGGVNVIPPFNSGANGEVLHQIVALAIHEVNSITDVYFNQDVISSGSITAVTGVSNDGLVTSGTYANYAYIRRYTGTASQTRDFRLNNAFPTAFGTDFRGRGIAYVALDYVFSQDVYASGLPNPTFTVLGKKLYDPRLDVTPGASPTNPSYIAHSDNPALVLCDYLMADYGGGYDPAEIDWSLVVAAANVCDVSLTTTVAPPSGAQKRYTCNIALQATDDFLGNCKLITDTMLGRFIFRDGQWRIYAGAWASATHNMDRTAFIGPVSIQASSPRDQRYNGVRAFFVNAAKNWQRVECFPRQNSTYKTNDGAESIQKEIELPGVTNEYLAQRICEFLLRQSRNQIQITGLLGPKWQRLALWETVAFDWPDMGWSSKTFRVAAYAVNPNGTVEIGLKEEQSGDWTDLLTAEYDNPSTSTMPTTNPTTPSAPLNFTITPQWGGLRFDWDEPTVNPVGLLYELWRAPGSLSLANSGERVWSGSSRRVDLMMQQYSNWWWWVRGLVPLTNYGEYQPNTFGLHGRAFLAIEESLGGRAFPDGEMYNMVLANSYFARRSGALTSHSFDLGNGVSAGRGSITIDSSGGTGVVLEAMLPKAGVAPDYPNLMTGQKGTLAFAFKRVNSGSPAFTFQAVAYNINPNSKASGLSAAYTLVSTVWNTGSATVGSWNVGYLPFTVPDSPCTHLGAWVTDQGVANSGQTRIGMLQVFMQ